MDRLKQYVICILPALCWMAALCSLSLAGCAAPAGPAVAVPATTSPTPAAMKALIDRLAISDAEATADPVFTPTKDTPKTDRRVIAYDAGEELVELGAEAFPSLVASLNDKRQSVAFRRTLPSSVGEACYTLITRQLYALPPGYSGSIFRKGADGQHHERPVFSKDLFSTVDLKQWLAARRGRTLGELQIEAFGWVLAEEEKIGAATPKDEEEFLSPLRAQSKALQGKLKR